MGVQLCNMMSVFDGHGGEGCANFLKDSLHRYLFEALDLKNLKASIKSAFANADQDFLRNCFSSKSALSIDKSGSTALSFHMLGTLPLT